MPHLRLPEWRVWSLPGKTREMADARFFWEGAKRSFPWDRVGTAGSQNPGQSMSRTSRGMADAEGIPQAACSIPGKPSVGRTGTTLRTRAWKNGGARVLRYI